MAAPSQPSRGQEARAAAGASSSGAAATGSSKRLLACIECRRRKQKCDYGMPCIHCARRFPQPACKYPTRNARAKKTGSRATAADSEDTDQTSDGVFQKETYSHLDLDGLKDVILQVERQPPRHSGFEDDVVSLFDALESLDSSSNSSGSPVSSSLQYQEKYWQHETDSTALVESSTFDHAVRVATRMLIGNKSGKVKPETMLRAFSLVMPHREAMARRVSEQNWFEDVCRVAVETSSFPALLAPVGGGGYSSLPLKLNDLDKKLVRTHLQFLSRFKVSIDGCPDPENRFMRHWVPFTISDPLLLQIVLFTAACFLSEWGSIPQDVVLAHKHRVYRRLNAAIATPEVQSSDAAILALAQIVVDSWYWGGSKDLLTHIKGLKTMIRMRGGLQKLGMQGFLSKLIITNDVCLSLSHEVEPFIYGQPGFEFEDPFMTPLQRRLNSPLLFEAPSFLNPLSSPQIHPSTAQILDDMRALLRTILSLPEMPTPEEQKAAQQMAALTFQRLREMPENIPMRSSAETIFEGSSEGSSPADGSKRSNDDDDDGDTQRRSQGSKSKSSPDGGESNRMDSSSPEGSQTQPPDLMYSSIRMIACIYCRAILQRTPTSNVCDVNEFLGIWYRMWQVSMAVWNKMIGIFIWALLPLVPSCHEAPKARFVETLITAGFVNTATENWHVAMEAADTALRFQRWLRGGAQARQQGKGGLGGKAPRIGEK